MTDYTTIKKDQTKAINSMDTWLSDISFQRKAIFKENTNSSLFRAVSEMVSYFNDLFLANILIRYLTSTRLGHIRFDIGIK